MNRTHLAQLAVELLRGQSDYLEDARVGAPVGNSVVGSLLSLQHGVPRQLAEAAVQEAVHTLTHEQSKPAPAGTLTLPRSGQAPLRFQGELLAEADGYRQNGKEQNRWHEIAVYRTPGGKYVVRIAYRTRWQGEGNHDFAQVADKAEQVGAILQEYNPIEHVAGFPVGDAYADKQARLLLDLRSRYEALVSEVLASDEDFAERVD